MLRLEPAGLREMALVRALFEEYARGTGVDLAFQNFAQELAGLPGDYDPIILARWNDQAAGCAALHPIDAQVCEMKRLYVREAHRGRGIGLALVQRMIEEARRRRFQRMRLDTLPDMTRAIAMYERFGFRDVPPYRYNPVPGSRFLELELG